MLQCKDTQKQNHHKTGVLTVSGHFLQIPVCHYIAKAGGLVSVFTSRILVLEQKCLKLKIM